MTPTPTDFQKRFDALIILAHYYKAENGRYINDHSAGIAKRKELGNIEFKPERDEGVFKWEESADYLKNSNGIMSRDIYMGEMDEWDNPHGRGVKITKYGGIYEGHFIDGNRHGKGRFIYCSGQVFEGEFQENLEHGKGKMTYPALE